METRLAGLADAPVLAVLHQQSFGAACWNVTQMTDSLKLPTSWGLVASAADALQGFILCQSTGDELEILTFCVAPDAQRKGIGAVLLNSALTSARQKDVQRVFLEVAADNAPAIALYEKAGFKTNGLRPGYYRHTDQAVDALMLALEL